MTLRMYLRWGAVLMLVAILAACSGPSPQKPPEPVFDPQAEANIREFLGKFEQVWDTQDVEQVLKLVGKNFAAPTGGREEFRATIKEGFAHGLKYRTENAPLRIEGNRAAASPIEASMTAHLQLIFKKIDGEWRWHGVDVLDRGKVLDTQGKSEAIPADASDKAAEGDPEARTFLDTFVVAWNSGKEEQVLSAMSKDFECFDGDKASCEDGVKSFIAVGAQMSLDGAKVRFEKGLCVAEPVSMSCQMTPVSFYLVNEGGQWLLNGLFPSRGAPESVEVPETSALPDAVDPEGSSRPVKDSQY